MNSLFISTHNATIRWKNTGPNFLKRLYSREHTIHFDGGVIVPGSPSPHIVPAPWSNATAVDPEEAFVASVASCHMLWFLHVAIDAGLEPASYEDEAVGEMTKNEQGRLWISRVTLHPRIEWRSERHPTAGEVKNLHQQAHDECFIANSIKTEVTIKES
jgi:organic hydroperoxide reductase OsmC/OhrA